MKRLSKSSCGLTLAEVLVSTVILVLAGCGLLYSYVTCLELDELGKNTTRVIDQVRAQVETIRNTTFGNISATYNNATFTLPGLTGIGKIYVASVDPNGLYGGATNTHVLQVKVVFCWKQSRGRIIGEDKNLNGVLNAGEDANNNGQIDSYVQVVTDIYG